MRLSPLINEEDIKKFLEKLINDTKSGDIDWKDDWDENDIYSEYLQKYFYTILNDRNKIVLFPAYNSFELSILETSNKKVYQIKEEQSKVMFGRLCNIVVSKISKEYYEKEYSFDEIILNYIKPANNLVREQQQ